MYYNTKEGKVEIDTYYKEIQSMFKNFPKKCCLHFFRLMIIQMWHALNSSEFYYFIYCITRKIIIKDIVVDYVYVYKFTKIIHKF